MIRAPSSLALAFALGLALVLPVALAHGTEEHLDDDLLENGQRLLLGRFTAPQEGALIVVPFHDGPLGCVPPVDAQYRVPLATNVSGAPLEAPVEAGVSFVSNATALAAYFDAPPEGRFYAGFAVDTHDASVTLILMEQARISSHALVGVVQREDGLETQTGELGLPYPIAGTSAHDMGGFSPEGGGVLMAHDDSFAGASSCAAEEPGHFAVLVESAALPDSIAPGKLVHAIAMLDATIEAFPPRPVDESTAFLRANLYLARAGEDPERVREGLDPRAKVPDLLPLVAVAIGLVWIARRP